MKQQNQQQQEEQQQQQQEPYWKELVSGGGEIPGPLRAIITFSPEPEESHIPVSPEMLTGSD